MCILHQGRSKYTFIDPLSQVKVVTAVMGIDTSKGEVRQLLNHGSVWKLSQIPAEDLEQRDPDWTGSLITEVVTPGGCSHPALGSKR
jgi:predicted cupin superfamily sugar epimerase